MISYFLSAMENLQHLEVSWVNTSVKSVSQSDFLEVRLRPTLNEMWVWAAFRTCRPHIITPAKPASLQETFGFSVIGFLPHFFIVVIVLCQYI